MRKTVWTALSLVALLGPALAGDAWVVFKDPGGRFRAMFPDAPTAKQITNTMGDGSDTVTTQYMSSRDDQGYAMAVFDTDVSRYSWEDPKKLVETNAQSWSSSATTVLSDTVCKLDGQEGREVVEIQGAFKIDARVFDVDGHVYQVIATIAVNADPSIQAMIDRFQKSFHFTAKRHRH